MNTDLFCRYPNHEDQRLRFPVGAIIETVSPVAHLGSAIPVGARGRITSHCDDGRAWILFDDYNDAGHTFHTPERFIRVVELPSMAGHEYDNRYQCDACGKLSPKDEVRGGNFSAGVEGLFCHECRHGKDCKCMGSEPPAPRAGERERVILNSDLVVRQMPNTLLKTKYLLTTDDDWPVAEFYREEEAEGIAYEHNQHAILIEQRERLLQLLRPVTSPTACYCAVMKGEKCWHCEARELLATIEPEGV